MKRVTLLVIRVSDLKQRARREKRQMRTRNGSARMASDDCYSSPNPGRYQWAKRVQ